MTLNESETASVRPADQGDRKARQVRKRPDVRAQEILAVAGEILAKEGYEGLTFRAVAVATGVRMSSVQYYYPSREALYAAVVGRTMDEWHRSAVSILTSDHPPEVRLDMICQWNITECMKAETRSILFQLLGMSQRESHVRRIILDGFVCYRQIYADVIREIRPDFDPDALMTFATLFVSHLEGLAIFLEPDDPVRPSEPLLRELSKEFVKGYVTSLERAGRQQPGVTAPAS
jgi:AcrR family transcriptional regulator